MNPLPDEYLLDVLISERETDWLLVADERENFSWFKTPPVVEIIYLPELVVKVLANEVTRERAREYRKVQGLERYRQRKRNGTGRDRNRKLAIYHTIGLYPRTNDLAVVLRLPDRGACQR